MLLLSSYKQQILRVLLKLDSRKRGGQKYSIQKEKKQVDMVDILKLFCHGKQTLQLTLSFCWERSNMMNSMSAQSYFGLTPASVGFLWA